MLGAHLRDVILPGSRSGHQGSLVLALLSGLSLPFESHSFLLGCSTNQGELTTGSGLVAVDIVGDLFGVEFRLQSPPRVIGAASYGRSRPPHPNSTRSIGTNGAPVKLSMFANLLRHVAALRSHPASSVTALVTETV